MLLIATKLFAKDFVWEQSKKKIKLEQNANTKFEKNTQPHTTEPERKKRNAETIVYHLLVCW